MHPKIATEIFVFVKICLHLSFFTGCKPEWTGNTIDVIIFVRRILMKKLCVAALLGLMVLSLAACGRKNDMMPTTKPTTVPTTVPATTTVPQTTVMPEIDPTLDTNIPDENVNGNSTDTTANPNK